MAAGSPFCEVDTGTYFWPTMVPLCPCSESDLANLLPSREKVSVRGARQLRLGSEGEGVLECGPEGLRPSSVSSFRWYDILAAGAAG